MQIVIDGKTCTGHEGQTVFDVARANGFDIPTLCHLADLVPTGECRICVVDIEGMRDLAASCSTPATDGMIVHENNERVRSARRCIVELLVSCHPIDCMTCEKTGNCTL